MTKMQQLCNLFFCIISSKNNESKGVQNIKRKIKIKWSHTEMI